MSRRNRKPLPCGIRLLITLATVVITIPLSIWLVRLVDVKHAEDEVHFRYPQAELIEVKLGEGRLSDEMTAYCWDPASRFVFAQHFSRDGTSWYAEEDTADSYENLLACRKRTDRVIAAAGKTDTPYKVIYAPCMTAGFLVITKTDDRDALTSLYEAFCPAAGDEKIPFCVLGAPTRYSLLTNTDFSELWHQELYDFEIGSGGTPGLVWLYGMLGYSGGSAAICHITDDPARLSEEWDTRSRTRYAANIPDAFAAADEVLKENPPERQHLIWGINYHAEDDKTEVCAYDAD